VKRRLLLAWQVVEFIEAWPRRDRQRLRQRLLEIAAAPAQFSDFTENDPANRTHDLHLFGPYAIRYWDDFADRDVKIIDIIFSDRAS
jgi:hypothetical protein